MRHAPMMSVSKGISDVALLIEGADILSKDWAKLLLLDQNNTECIFIWEGMIGS